MTYEEDITGQKRKMGRNAGMRDDGTNDSANMAAGKASGEISLRTINPGEADTGDMTPTTGGDSAASPVRSKSYTR